MIVVMVIIITQLYITWLGLWEIEQVQGVIMHLRHLASAGVKWLSVHTFYEQGAQSCQPSRSSAIENKN